MRWSFSNGVLLALAAACVTTTTRAFLPSPQNPRYSASQAEPVLAEYVRLQCAPLRKAQRPDSGTARFVIEVDSSGAATRAELVRATADSLLDGVFGTVAAQLTVAAAQRPQRGTRRQPVDIAWRCDSAGAAVQVRAGARP